MAVAAFVFLCLACAWLCLYGAYDKVKSGSAAYQRPPNYPAEQWETDRAADPADFSDAFFYARRSMHPIMFWLSVVVNLLVAGVFLTAVGMVVFGGVPVKW